MCPYINTILGREYNTIYWPLRDIEGKIAGMLFIGKDRASIIQTQHEMFVTVGISVLVIVGLMALAAFFIARSIAGPIQRVSQGLVDSTARVASVAAQVSGSSKVLSDGATEQAAAIEETSSSLEEMASMTQQNAANAEESVSASEELAAQADQMKVMVNELFKLIGGNAGLKHARPAFTKAAQRRITDSGAVFQHPVCALQPDDAWRASALVR